MSASPIGGVVDGWRLAQGTLTALPVPPPRQVTPRVAGAAMLLGPVAALPLAAAVAGIGLLGTRLDLSPLALAVLAVAALALGTRVLHWDGLADVADGLTASYDRERSLAVMKTGDVGPAGVVAVVLVAGLQVAGLAALLTDDLGAVTAAVAVVGSRAALALACLRGIPSARPDGLGAAVAGTVPLLAAVLLWLALGAALVLLAGPRGAVAAAIAVVVVVLLRWRCVSRLGGITGDVLGAAVELALAALLVAV